MGPGVGCHWAYWLVANLIQLAFVHWSAARAVRSSVVVKLAGLLSPAFAGAVLSSMRSTPPSTWLLEASVMNALTMFVLVPRLVTALGKVMRLPSWSPLLYAVVAMVRPVTVWTSSRYAML